MRQDLGACKVVYAYVCAGSAWTAAAKHPVQSSPCLSGHYSVEVVGHQEAFASQQLLPIEHLQNMDD